MLTILAMLIVPGQLLLDGNDPYKVLDRLDKPFFAPEAPFEKSGQYKDGTVFIEGLVYHNEETIPLLWLCGFTGGGSGM